MVEQKREIYQDPLGSPAPFIMGMCAADLAKCTAHCTGGYRVAVGRGTRQRAASRWLNFPAEIGAGRWRRGCVFPVAVMVPHGLAAAVVGARKRLWNSDSWGKPVADLIMN